MGPGLSTEHEQSGECYPGSKDEGVPAVPVAFPGAQAGNKDQREQKTRSQQASGYKVGCKHRCCDGHRLPHFQPRLTSPFMSGFAPIASCIFFTSLLGPVMSEVPVSTMASQPP